MREIRTSGLMSGDGKRGTATAPVLDSTTDHCRRNRVVGSGVLLRDQGDGAALAVF
jgi:hypothetical protein